MFRNSRILVPTDFSDYAAIALRYASALAQTYQAVLQLVHVLDERVLRKSAGPSERAPDAGEEAMMAEARMKAGERLAQLVNELKDEGVEAEHHVALGHPVEEITRFAKELGCDLIVIATHGHSGFDRFVFGSVCDKVIRRAEVPVLSVKPPQEGADEQTPQPVIKRILYPTDFSEYADAVLPYAVSLCRELGAELVLFHATEMAVMMPEFMLEDTAPAKAEMEQYAREAMERVRSGVADVHVETQLTVGTPFREICRAVKESSIDLVVIPTHGRSGFAKLLFGGVAERVVRRAACPVMTIRPPRDEK